LDREAEDEKNNARRHQECAPPKRIVIYRVDGAASESRQTALLSAGRTGLANERWRQQRANNGQ